MSIDSRPLRRVYRFRTLGVRMGFRWLVGAPWPTGNQGLMIRFALIEGLPGNEDAAATAALGEAQAIGWFKKFPDDETLMLPPPPPPPPPPLPPGNVPDPDPVTAPVVCRMLCLDSSRLCSRIAFRSLASFGL